MDLAPPAPTPAPAALTLPPPPLWRRFLRRRAAVLTLVSLLGWLTWNHVRTPAHPWADLSRGHHTDHFSHMNAARAVTRVGLDLWKKGASQLFPAASAAQMAGMPADIRVGGSWTGGVYMVPGWPAHKPWVTSWSSKPRLYPPGDLLLVAPISALYHFTGLSLAEANRWLISLFLLFTHLALFFALDHALREGGLGTPLLWASALLFCSEATRWTLEGFYDAAACAPLLLCALFLHQKRGLAAAVAYCVAAFIHFRAFFLAPWALYAAWVFVRGKQWRGLRLRDYGAALGALACAGASLTAFALVTPTLAGQEINNPVSLSVPLLNGAAIVPFALLLALGAAALASARAWLDLAVLAWMSMMIFYVKEAYPWHVLILMSWLPAPVSVVKPGGAELVRLVRLGILGFVGFVVMRSSLWPAWVLELFK